MALKLSTRTVQGVMIVDCIGRITFGDEAASLRDIVKNLLPQSREIVLNLKDVSYVDSGGLGTMVGLYTSARASGGELKLCQLTHRVGDLLQVTKLLTVFDVHDTEESAIAAFRKAATA
jgi:anti-sigma B factor antagonist